MITLVLVSVVLILLSTWAWKLRRRRTPAAVRPLDAPPSPPVANAPPARAMQQCYRLGAVTNAAGEDERAFTIDDGQLVEHMTVLGRTGSGKSRFLNQLIREHLARRKALILLDPDGDLAEDILGYVAGRVIETGKTRILGRIHYLEPTPFLNFSYDPFAFYLPKPVAPELLQSVREAWLHCKVDRVADILLRKQGQQTFEGMPRLQRVLRDVLYVLGTLVEGRRLSLADAGFILDFRTPLNERLWEKVSGFLPRDIASDFQLIRAMRRVEDMRRETESTVNRLRSFGPLVRSIFTATDRDKTLDLFRVIQQGEILLVNLRPSHFLSPDQARALGQLFLYDAFATAMITPREMRKPCTLVVDEAAEYVSDDIGAMMRRGRKYQFAVVLASQMLSSFRRADCDLTDVVTSQPRTIVTFNQRLPQDLDFLGRVMFTKWLDFTPLTQEVERDGGTVFVPVTEFSVGRNKGTNWTNTETKTASQGTSATVGTSLADALGWTKVRQEQESRGTSNTTSRSSGNGETSGANLTPIVNRGELQQVISLPTTQVSVNHGTGDTVGESRQTMHGVSDGTSGTKTRTTNQQFGETTQHGASSANARGGSDGATYNVSVRLAQIQRTVRELQQTGQLARAINDQLAQFAQVIFSLERQEAVALVGSDAFLIRTENVPDPFRSPEALMQAIDWVKGELRNIHPYLFVPNLHPAEDERRIRAFLDGPMLLVDAGRMLPSASTPAIVDDDQLA